MKNKVPKKLLALAICGALLVPTGAMAGEIDTTTTNNEKVSLADYASYIQ